MKATSVLLALLFLCGRSSTCYPGFAEDIDKDIAAAIDILSKTAETQTERIQQVFALVRRHTNDKSLKVLITYLDDPTATRRRSAIYIMYMLPWDDGSPAFPPLRKLLTHSETLTRGMSAMALASMGDKQSLDAQVNMLENDDDPYARRCAAWALGELKNQKAIVHLKKALNDSNAAVKANSQNAIERLGFLREFQDVKGPAKTVYEGVWLISGSVIFQKDRINRAIAMIRTVDKSVRQPILEKLQSSKSVPVRNSAFLADGKSIPVPGISELKVFQPFMGTWDSEMDIPNQGKVEAVSTNEWVLGKRFIQSKYKSNSSEGMLITTWDQQAQAFRRWQFDAAGLTIEYTGKWDADSKTMTFKSRPDSNGVTWQTTDTITEEGKNKWTVVVKDAAGNSVFEIKGVGTRRAQ